MKYAILTFGCRVNQADSLEFEAGLRARGGLETDVAAADLVIVNTCSVTGAADRGARQTIRRISRDNAGARIVVTGCYATRQPADLASLPNVIRLVPNAAKDDLVRDVVREVVRDLAPTTAHRFGDGEGGCGAAMEPGVMGRTAYALRVQTGCEETCSFCIIPSTRGRSRSRTPADVLADASKLAASGYKEIWLVGVHMGSYGRDLQPPSTLVDLLRALDGLPEDITFRLSSLEPMDCSHALVDLVARSGRFAPHFHLPLQHAGNRMLVAMRRPYTFEFYRSLVDHIHARLPYASIGTDLIVGFPGEREDEAEHTARTLERLPLSYLHVFPYSDRPGTQAVSMSGKIDGAAIKSRAERLRGIGRCLVSRFVESQVGQVRPGLTLDDGTLVLTDNFLKVQVPPGLTRNVRVQVRIDAVSPVLMGTVVRP